MLIANLTHCPIRRSNPWITVYQFRSKRYVRVSLYPESKDLFHELHYANSVPKLCACFSIGLSLSVMHAWHEVNVNELSLSMPNVSLFIFNVNLLLLKSAYQDY